MTAIDDPQVLVWWEDWLRRTEHGNLPGPTFAQYVADRMAMLRPATTFTSWASEPEIRWTPSDTVDGRHV